MKRVLLLLALLALPGCELLQKGRKAEDGRTMMMIADTVPLAAGEKTWARGQAMPVPVEPSPFEKGKNKKPAAMLSDIEPPVSRVEKAEAEPRPIPKEPIP